MGGNTYKVKGRILICINQHKSTKTTQLNYLFTVRAEKFYDNPGKCYHLPFRKTKKKKKNDMKAHREATDTS